jgi:quercetin dioxygenase-like cupin family protein
MSDYFSASGTESNTPGQWVKPANLLALDMGEGVTFRPTLGQNLLVNHVEITPQSHAARHHHEEEQIAYVLEGELDIEVSGDRRQLGPGELVVIPSHAAHEVWTHEQGVTLIDIFAPPRQALVSRMRSERS